MRGLKTTLLLLAVLAGLVAYIYFVDADRDPNAADPLPKAFAVEAGTIDALEIRHAAGETVRLEKQDDVWRIVEPVTAEGDEGAVETVTNGLAALEVQRVVDENPTDLSQYGLEPTRLELGFRAAGDENMQRLLVGEKTPTGGDLYAKLPGEQRVFLIASYLDSSFNRTAFDLREKSILQFGRDDVEAIEVAGEDTNVRLTRTGADWRLTEPIQVRADYAAAEAILNRLSSSQMQRIEAETAEDLSRYGLDDPALTASVSSGSSRATLLLGRSGEDVFGKDSTRPMVFTVEPAVLDELAKDPSELRRKDLFDARSFTANRIELRRGSETTVAEKSAEGEGEEVWRTGSGQELDTAAVEALMSALGNVRAQSFDAESHPALQMPELVVTVRFDDNKTETVRFGRTDDGVVASRADEPGTATVDTAAFEEAIAALEELTP